MWKLVSERQAQGDAMVVYRFIVGKEYSLGRRDCDIIISDDMSISRKHVIIKILHQDENIAFPTKKSVMHIKDISKLGTILREERISNGEERDVNDRDLLFFGTGGISKYRAIYEPFIITTSCLAQASKKDVKRCLLKLGGHLLSEWTRECSVVVMTNLSVTIKVICSLLCLKPVVTPQYLEDLIKAIESNAKLPDAEDYLPCLSESQINPTDVSFGPDARRRSLFVGKSFIFLSLTQFKKLQNAVELGGAKTLLIVNENYNEKILLSEGSCVMMPLNDGSKMMIDAVQSLLRSGKKRMINESEIGFAVLYCSTDMHCNPNVESAAATFTRFPKQSLSQIPEVPQPEFTSSQSTIKRSLNVPEISTVVTPTTPVLIKEEPLSQSARKQKRNWGEEIFLNETNVEAVDATSQLIPLKKCRIDVAASEEEDNIKQTDTSNIAKENSVMKTIDCESLLMTNKGLDSCHFPRTESMVELVTANDNNVVGGKLEVEDLFASYSNIASQNLELCLVASGDHVLKSADKRPIDANHVKVEWENVKPNAFKENVKIQPGFLSATRPIKMRADPDYETVQDLPSKVVITEKKCLVMQQHSRSKSMVIADDGRMVLWNGRRVQNFKKFRKNLVSSGLPRIIGGRDLAVHKPSTEQEEYFRIGLYEESQKQNVDMLSQELFGWQPPARRR